MALDKTLLNPPSIVFPLVGAAAGYLLGKSDDGANGWAILAGALGGALFNASSKLVAQKSAAAQSSGASSFSGNVGGEAVSALLGTSDAAAKQQVAAGNRWSMVGGNIPPQHQRPQSWSMAAGNIPAQNQPVKRWSLRG